MPYALSIDFSHENFTQTFYLECSPPDIPQKLPRHLPRQPPGHFPIRIYLCQLTVAAHGLLVYFSFAHLLRFYLCRMQTWSSNENSVCSSVCPSVKRVNCDKMRKNLSRFLYHLT